MPDYQQIYHTQADQYERLVSREDYQHNIFSALNRITSLDGLTVAEFGAGTGRLTCLLAPVVKYIHAFDASQHMLDVAVAKLKKSGLQNWQVAICDHRQVSLEGGLADVAISGWSMCYMVVDHQATWQNELSQALGEMRRVLRPGGMVILLETLGTGYRQPQPPAVLAPYYEFLAGRGFHHTWIRTDYQFQDMAEAEELTRFFFGDAMVEKIEANGSNIILPECTGIWWIKQEALVLETL
jgi:ubiquinone/menaquinone biosynthesis C-methylase UbiE